MHCIRCGKQLPPGAAFCAHCGAKQTGAGKAAKGTGNTVAVAAVAAGVVILGGMGYWAWSQHAAKEEAAQKVSAQAAPASGTAPARATPASQPAASGEDAAERAEIVAAQAALAKHIMEEEAQAKARAGLK